MAALHVADRVVRHALVQSESARAVKTARSRAPIARMRRDSSNNPVLPMSFPLNARAARRGAPHRRAAARARRRRQRQDARDHRQDRAPGRARASIRRRSSRSRSPTRPRARCASARRRCCASRDARDAAGAVRIATFHALGLSIVRAEATRARPQARRSRSSIPPTSSRSSAELVATADRGRARTAQWRDQRDGRTRWWRRRRRSRARAATTSELRRGARLRALRRHAGGVPGGRLRRPDRAAARAVRARRRRARALAGRASRTCWSTSTRTPIPRSTGCSAQLVGAHDAVHRRRRRRPGDLRLARRDARQPRARCRATIRGSR